MVQYITECMIYKQNPPPQHTFLYRRGLQHLLEVRVVQSTLCPKGDLPLHFLKALRDVWLYKTQENGSL